MVALATRTLLGAVVLVAAVVVYVMLVRTAPQIPAADPQVAQHHVAVIKAARMPVRRQWRGYGTVDPIESADVPARVTATVVQISRGIAAGHPVKAGDLLVLLDHSDFVRQVEIAQQELADLDAQLTLIDIQEQQLTERLVLETADVELAEAKLDRVFKVLDRGAGKPQDLDDAKRELISTKRTRLETVEAREKLEPQRRSLQAQRASLRSSLALAKYNVERCRITSPIDGILQSVDVEVGESTGSGQRVARVVDLRQVEVPLRLAATARAAVAVGDKVDLSVTTPGGMVWTGQISRIAPEDDALTRTFTVFVEVEQLQAASTYGQVGAPPLLTPGMFLAGVVTSGPVQSRWVVPRRAVREGRVWLVHDGTVVSRSVRVDFAVERRMSGLGLPDDQWVVLSDGVTGLRDGELVVVNASPTLADGWAVVPSLPSVPAAEAATDESAWGGQP